MRRCTAAILRFFIGVCLSLGLIMCACLLAEHESAKQQPNHWPGVTIDCQDSDLDRYSLFWKTEIARRFPDAVGILCHGGDSIDGVWSTSAGAYGHKALIQDLVRREQRLHPGRTIVVLACNTGRLPLGIPGVYYAPGEVWCVPDRACKGQLDITSDMKLDNPVTLPPLPFPFLPMPLTMPAPEGFKVVQNRWERDPAAVGNIFEFIKD